MCSPFLQKGGEMKKKKKKFASDSDREIPSS
jgi:hypothetical protein